MKSIVLLGPSAAGKTAVGRALSCHLDIPLIDARESARMFKETFGFLEETSRDAWQKEGLQGAYDYAQALEAMALTRILRDLGSDKILEVGGLQASLRDSRLRAEISNALFRHTTILLRHSHDDAETLRQLDRRLHWVPASDHLDDETVEEVGNSLLATRTVFTDGRTPEETCEEVLQVLDPSDSTIVLIGPQGAGKSTVAHLICERVQKPRACLDAIRFDYYREIGWNQADQDRALREGGVRGMIEYWKPFEAYGVERVLQDHKGAAIDFGAGHSVQEDPILFGRLSRAIRPFKNVVLLMPSPNRDISRDVLRKRRVQTIDGLEENDFILRYLSEIAGQTVYTKGKHPEDVAAEIHALTADSELMMAASLI